MDSSDLINVFVAEKIHICMFPGDKMNPQGGPHFVDCRRYSVMAYITKEI